MDPKFVVDIELRGIRGFLDRVGTMVEAEYSTLIDRDEAGELPDDMDERANAFFPAMMCDEIATRAVLAELNALVEWELNTLGMSRALATHPPGARSRSWMLGDDPLAVVKRRVEEELRIRLENVDGYEQVEELRRTTNAYKHRRGFKHPERDGVPLTEMMSKHELSRDRAREYIDAVRRFLYELHDAAAAARARHGRHGGRPRGAA